MRRFIAAIFVPFAFALLGCDATGFQQPAESSQQKAQSSSAYERSVLPDGLGAHAKLKIKIVEASATKEDGAAEFRIQLKVVSRTTAYVRKQTIRRTPVGRAPGGSGAVYRISAGGRTAADGNVSALLSADAPHLSAPPFNAYVLQKGETTTLELRVDYKPENSHQRVRLAWNTFQFTTSQEDVISGDWKYQVVAATTEYVQP